jgi:hypothetical protein
MITPMISNREAATRKRTLVSILFTVIASIISGSTEDAKKPTIICCARCSANPHADRRQDGGGGGGGGGWGGLGGQGDDDKDSLSLSDGSGDDAPARDAVDPATRRRRAQRAQEVAAAKAYTEEEEARRGRLRRWLERAERQADTGHYSQVRSRPLHPLDTRPLHPLFVGYASGFRPL